MKQWSDFHRSLHRPTRNGRASAGPDLPTIRPARFAARQQRSANHFFVQWGWGGYTAGLDICEIQVDRGEGKDFVLLAFDTTPGHTDTRAFPATPAIWTDRAICRRGDNPVGLWCNPASRTVPA
ncbi:MAG: hypothetical protein P4N60_16700 [Verrucomicrobiae bacterium]|nr:hypothetical protein [Verrucomicrobiae bacterium]